MYAFLRMLFEFHEFSQAHPVSGKAVEAIQVLPWETCDRKKALVS